VSAGAPASGIDPLDIVEKEWARQVAELAALTGFARYHTYRSKRSPSGFPDEVFVRERILFAELKREKTRPTPDQVEWLDKLARAGGEVYLWRPSDLEEIGVVLSRRWMFYRVDQTLSPLADYEGGSIAPGSMWIAGHGRRDS